MQHGRACDLRRVLTRRLRRPGGRCAPDVSSAAPPRGRSCSPAPPAVPASLPAGSGALPSCSRQDPEGISRPGVAAWSVRPAFGPVAACLPRSQEAGGALLRGAGPDQTEPGPEPLRIRCRPDRGREGLGDRAEARLVRGDQPLLQPLLHAGVLDLALPASALVELVGAHLEVPLLTRQLLGMLGHLHPPCNQLRHSDAVKAPSAVRLHGRVLACAVQHPPQVDRSRSVEVEMLHGRAADRGQPDHHREIAAPGEVLSPSMAARVIQASGFAAHGIDPFRLAVLVALHPWHAKARLASSVAPPLLLGMT